MTGSTCIKVSDGKKCVPNSDLSGAINSDQAKEGNQCGIGLFFCEIFPKDAAPYKACLPDQGSSDKNNTLCSNSQANSKTDIAGRWKINNDAN
jgi:hypothetical protein